MVPRYHKKTLRTKKPETSDEKQARKQMVFTRTAPEIRKSNYGKN